jgi:hypothetical protein
MGNIRLPHVREELRYALTAQSESVTNFRVCRRPSTSLPLLIRTRMSSTSAESRWMLLSNWHCLKVSTTPDSRGDAHESQLVERKRPFVPCLLRLREKADKRQLRS